MLFALIAPIPPLSPCTLTPAQLCNWLSQTTGVVHEVAGELRDFPIFVAVKGSGPKRIEALVATALAGRWEEDGKTLRLMPIKPKPDEGLAEFERSFKAAVPASSALSQLPAADLYRMRIGENIRYGLTAGSHVRPFPLALARKVEATSAGTGTITLRRDGSGIFEVLVDLPSTGRTENSDSNELMLKKLPEKVGQSLGATAQKTVAKEILAQIAAVRDSPTPPYIDPKSFGRVDPVGSILNPLLVGMAQAIEPDLVVALPDSCLLAFLGNESGPTIESKLASLNASVDLVISDGAIVGRLPVSERRDQAQVRRSAIAAFAAKYPRGTVPTLSTFADYLGTQRPAASERWGDLMMLFMAGVSFDQSFVEDYPYNLRFGAALLPNDWRLLQSGRPFPLEALSRGAKESLVSLLHRSHARVLAFSADPVFWPDFAPGRLLLRGETSNERVLIETAGDQTKIVTADQAFGDFQDALNQHRPEPLYRIASRKSFTVHISPQTHPDVTIDTGFAEVHVDASAKPVRWNGLPKEIQKEALPPDPVPPPIKGTGPR